VNHAVIFAVFSYFQNANRHFAETNRYGRFLFFNAQNSVNREPQDQSVARGEAWTRQLMRG